MLTHHGFSLYFIDNIATVTDWCSMKIITKAKAELGDIYRLTYTPELYESHTIRDTYLQTLPKSMSPAICLMAKTATAISNTDFILSDPIGRTNELIVDSGCSDHMFNTNVQLTDYRVMSTSQKYVQVANGHRIPVLGIGCCGFLKNVYYVPALSHSLLSVRALTAEGFNVTFTSDNVTITSGSSKSKFEPMTGYIASLKQTLN